MIDDVLIPTDGSDCAEAATEFAIDLADTYDATLHALYIEETSPDRVDRPPVFEVRVEETECGPIQNVLQTAQKRDIGDFVGGISSGQPSAEITRYVDIRPVDVVVMGTQDRSGLDRIFDRKTTESVVRQSAVPVLAVPQRADRADGGPTGQ